MSSEAIMLFVDRLVEEKNFEKLDPEVLGQIKSDLMDRVDDLINAMTLEHLPPEKLDEFNSLLDDNDMDKIHSFCQVNISDFDNIIAKELMNFRAIYLNA